MGNGVGSYLGYSDITFINGSLGVTAVAPNGSVSATYTSAYSYSNSNGGSQRGSSGGSFTFSAQTFLYLQGTDNQTGCTNPSVWFYVNNSLTAGGHLELLNTPMTVVSTTSSYPLPTDPSRSVRTNLCPGDQPIPAGRQLRGVHRIVHLAGVLRPVHGIHRRVQLHRTGHGRRR